MRNPGTKYAPSVLRLFLIILVASTGCRPEQPAREPEIVQLDPEEAVRMAEEIRQEVSVELAEGLDVSLWASERLLADPVAMHIDELGRVWTTQTTRHRLAEFDIRDRPEWMISSITLQTVEDRRAFLQRELSPERSDENVWLVDRNEDGSHDWRDLTVLQERVYRIEDTSGDGLADRSQVFFEGFNEEVSDIAAGVFSWGDDVYVTVAPDLWRLRDSNGDGWADVKESVKHGFGVHIGFSGHGLSGPTMGPDGRLYWAIGDYGAHIVDRNGNEWNYPNQGVVARSNLDGSDFEIYAAGLRNTHEFVFDQYGNLISVDNDGDHPGEYERIVYITEGSDTGWRINWQFGKYTDPDNNEYKVWMDEGLYQPRFEGQAAYITPPIAPYHAGPSGLAYNPGTALSSEWQNFVFVSSFTGTPPRSRITAFRLQENGAGFDLAEDREVLSGLQATSMAFGPDGALYFSDWIEGWGMNNEGRIWKMDAPDVAGSGPRIETQQMLPEDFSQRTREDLFQLMQHEDMRIRQKAQFALADRGLEGRETLVAAIDQRTHQLARIHGIWGLGQLARQGADVGGTLVQLLEDQDAEIRAQAAKTLGDIRYAPAAEALIPLLQDGSARPRFFSAEALGRIGYEPAVQPIIDMLEENDDQDVFLRHSGTLALARIGNAEPVAALADHPSRGLRIAAVVALRRMQAPAVARFLDDEDEYIVTETARAINDDFSIEAALPDLARVIENDRFSDEALLRRAINANLRLGTAEDAQRVAAFAGRNGAPADMRAEALASLGVWPNPSILDRVDGRYRGAVQRDPAIARDAIAPIIESVFADGSAQVRAAAAETVGRLHYEPAAPTLIAMIQNDQAPVVRTTALEALHVMQDNRLEEGVRIALADNDQSVRMTGLRLLPDVDMPEETVVDLLASVVEGGSVDEQQSALQALGEVDNARSHEVLDGLLNQLAAGTLPQQIQLDVILAIEQSTSQELQASLQEYQNAKPTGDYIAMFRETLHGGDVASGRQIFLQHSGAQCIRCHAVGPFGGDVGPPMSGVGSRLSREDLLLSLIDPNARIAPGYGMVTLALEDGQTVSGIVAEETPTHLTIQTGGGDTRQIATTDISQRREAPSGMPPMGTILDRREIRDVVEFLSSLE